MGAIASQAHSGIWLHRLLDSETDRFYNWGKGGGGRHQRKGALSQVKGEDAEGADNSVPKESLLQK